MRKSHLDQVERWAKFVRENPNKWQEHHTKFINSLFLNHEEFFKKLASTPNGKEKILKLRKLKL